MISMMFVKRRKLFFDSSAYVTSPNTALLHDFCETEAVNNAIRYLSSLHSCCSNRYKNLSFVGRLQFQPGLGIRLEKSLVLIAPMDSAAPKSWLGIIQKDCVRCS
jgi:hypothetical protein